MSTGTLSLPRFVDSSPPKSAAEAKLDRLVARLQADELEAFDELYRLTRDDVARTLWHLLGRRTDLEDLIQETYLQLLKSVRRFRGQAQFRTFLYRVCANVALMHLRWWRRRKESVVETLPETADAGADPERQAQAAQAKALVHRALETLPAKKRVVFVYHELLGMGPEEISEALEVPYNTVRSRLHHAREAFTAAMATLLKEGGR